MQFSETHLTNEKNSFIPGFRLYITNDPDVKARGRATVLVRNRINYRALEAI